MVPCRQSNYIQSHNFSVLCFRAVAAMANELRQLVDTANAPIFGIDVDGNVNEWNNKTVEIINPSMMISLYCVSSSKVDTELKS